jgi:hypothetical protein
VNSLWLRKGRPALLALFVIVMGTALLMWPAFLNGFPIFTYSSGGYLADFFQSPPQWPSHRSLIYAYFLRGATLGSSSLWAVVVSQAAITAWLLRVFFQLTWSIWSELHFLLAVLCLSLLTPIPWYISQISPDFMTPLLFVVSVIFLSFWAQASFPAKVGTVFVWGVGLLFNFYYPALIVVYLIGVGIFLCFCEREHLSKAVLKISMRPWLLGILVLIVAATGIRLGDGRKPFVWGWPNYLLARMAESGTLSVLLSQECGKKHFRLCEFQSDISKTTVMDFLFSDRSPFNATTESEWNGYRREAKTLIFESLKTNPVLNMRAGLKAWILQTAMPFEGNDWLVPIAAGSLAGSYFAPLTSWFPSDYLAARESIKKWNLTMDVRDMTKILCGWAFWLTFVLLTIYAFVARDSSRLICASAVLFLISNSFVCGIFFGSRPRLQERAAGISVLCFLSIGAKEKMRRWR